MTQIVEEVYLKNRTNNNPQAPRTFAKLVVDSARNQTLDQSLLSLIERNALGFPPFSTVTDYAADNVCFYDRKLWKFTAAKTAGAWDSTKATEFSIKEYCDAIANALQKNLKDGDVVPALAGNLESWADNNVPVENNFDTTVRTTAGDDPINSDDGGIVKNIIPVTDFKCTGLLATAENQLRLKSNGGGAVAVGAGWYFPVPKLTLGTFGTTDENNGLLLVDNMGANIQNATVYFKALASGVPTSVTDGTQLTPQTVTYGDKTYKVYTTSGPGYIIVSGITYANTCARIAWEDWYDKFVSPTDPNDVGGSINLAPLFAAAPNGTGKFLVCGNAYTYGERISATQWKITDPIGRIASPSWTDTPDEVEEGETQT